MLAARSAREPAVVVRHELGREGVRGFDIADLAQSELLDQPILQRQMSALYAALRRRRMSAQEVDVQAAEGSYELRDSGPRAPCDQPLARVVERAVSPRRAGVVIAIA